MGIINNYRKKRIQKAIETVYSNTIQSISDNFTGVSKLGYDGVPSNGSASSSIASFKFKKGRFFTSNRAEFSDSSGYNLSEFINAYETESYISRAVNQYVHSVLQRGYQFVGNNAKAVDYITNRINAMCIRSNQTFRGILTQNVTSLYLCGNIFNALSRNEKLSDGKVWYTKQNTGRSVKAVKPIAGIFPQDPIGMRIAYDRTKNRIDNYYMNPSYDSGDTGATSSNVFTNFYNSYANADRVFKWNKNEMMHLKFQPLAGRIWAMPPLQPVLEDILVLREIEENVQLLIHQHGHPFLHAKILLPDSVERRKEINDIKTEINFMEGNGVLFTGEHVEIENLNTDSGGMDLQGYLGYFQQRVFTGLFTSGVSMGQGDSANRNTSSVIDKKQQEVTKEIQEILKDGFQDILDQLLLEAGLTMQEVIDNRVELFFPNPDLDSLIKVESHALLLYHGNVITEDEMRELIGKRSLTEEERKKLYFNTVELQKAEIIAKYEANVSQTGKIGVNSNGNSKVDKSEGATKKIENKVRPSNQYGQKSGPGSVKN